MEGTIKPAAIAAAIICAGVLAAVPITSKAQQTSARGMSGNMDIMRLQRSIAALKKDTAALTKEHQQLMVCQNRKMAYAPSDEHADSDGCVGSDSDMQAGVIIDNTGKNTTRTRTVTFRQPFDTVPKVAVAVQGYYFNGPCRGDTVDFGPEASNITKTGFSVVMSGKNGGCGKRRVKGIVWIASTKLAESIISPPPASPPSNSSQHGSLCSGGGDTDCTRHPFASDPSDYRSWNGGLPVNSPNQR